MLRNVLMDEQTRLLSLAQLKNGKTPADTAELMNITYAAALKLRKELIAAEENNKILNLFNLEEAALEILLDSVTKQLTPAIEAFGIGELVAEETKELSKSVRGGNLLNQELQTAASSLTKKITAVSLVVNNAETLLALSKALVELNNSFKPSDGGASLGAASFEKHLRS